MKMARVILFTGRSDARANSTEKAGLKQVTNEKGWQEFAEAAPASDCIPARHRQSQGSEDVFQPRTSRPCGKPGGARRKFRQGPAGGK